jgi:hypothetical protein
MSSRVCRCSDGASRLRSGTPSSRQATNHRRAWSRCLARDEVEATAGGALAGLGRQANRVLALSSTPRQPSETIDVGGAPTSVEVPAHGLISCSRDQVSERNEASTHSKSGGR